MRTVRRALVFVVVVGAFAALAACNSLNGVDDLTADLPTEPIDAPERSLGEDGGTSSGNGGSSSSSSGGPNPSDVDGATTDALAPAPPSRIRDITFEDNAIVHPTTGWDSVVGSPSVSSLNPIGGKLSMRVETNPAYGAISFAAANELYVSLSFRMEGASLGNAANTYVLRITHGGGEPIEAFVNSARELNFVQGDTPITKFGLGDKQLYRLELHLKSPGSIQVHLEGGGASSTTGGSGAIGASTKLEVGTLSGSPIKAMFDDVSLDRAVQP